MTMIGDNMYRAFNSHFKGESHVRSGKPCQDFSLYSHCEEVGYQIIAVSDGHGSNKSFRSEKGSEWACEIAVECAEQCLREEDFMSSMSRLIRRKSELNIHDEKIPNSDFDRESELKKKVAEGINKLLVQLEKSIIMAWNQKVLDDISANEFSEEDLSVYDEERRARMKDLEGGYGTRAYGATLLLAVICKDFWFGLHIGDGTFVTVTDDGVFNRPIAMDDRCVGNVVTSICDNDAISLFHHAYGCEKLKAIFIASDGVDESFNSEESFYGFYVSIIQEVGADFEASVKDLKEFLPTLTKKGSQDDVSLAWLIKVRETVQLSAQTHDNDVLRGESWVENVKDAYR